MATRGSSSFGEVFELERAISQELCLKNENECK